MITSSVSSTAPKASQKRSVASRFALVYVSRDYEPEGRRRRRRNLKFRNRTVEGVYKRTTIQRGYRYGESFCDALAHNEDVVGLFKHSGLQPSRKQAAYTLPIFEIGVMKVGIELRRGYLRRKISCEQVFLFRKDAEDSSQRWRRIKETHRATINGNKQAAAKMPAASSFRPLAQDVVNARPLISPNQREIH